MELTEFLLSRIAEDEAAARAGDRADVEFPSSYVDAFGARDRDDDLGEFVRRFTPARVLAECEAKRRIVAEHREETVQQWVHDPEGPDYQETEHSCVICGWFPGGSACNTLRILAAVYADHPDYDEAWRP